LIKPILLLGRGYAQWGKSGLVEGGIGMMISTLYGVVGF